MSRSREIAEELAAELGLLPPGTRVGTEAAIGERFKVGRAAARAALQELERRALVRRVQGAGTFTARRVDYLISNGATPSWSATIRAAGATPRTRVLSCEPVEMPPRVAARLGRPVGSRCFLLHRRSFSDGLPASWGAEWVPADLLPELPTAVRVEESLDRILRDMAGVAPERAWTRATLETARADGAAGLCCRTGDPAWLVENLNRDADDGRLLVLTERWIRFDAIRVVLETNTPPRG